MDVNCKQDRLLFYSFYLYYFTDKKTFGLQITVFQKKTLLLQNSTVYYGNARYDNVSILKEDYEILQ